MALTLTCVTPNICTKIPMHIVRFDIIELIYDIDEAGQEGRLGIGIRMISLIRKTTMLELS